MATPKTLSIDVGSSTIKGQVVGPRGGARSVYLQHPTPDPLTRENLTTVLLDIAGQLAPFDRVAVGLPGIIHRGVVYSLPVRGDRRLQNFPLAKALERHLDRPTRLANDAEMHGLGVIERRGVELVLTLGTGLGIALFLRGEIGPRLQIAPLPEHREPLGGAYGESMRRRLGNRRWNRRVHHLIRALRTLTNFDRCYVGGGNVTALRGALGRGVTRASPASAMLGGVRLWDSSSEPSLTSL